MKKKQLNESQANQAGKRIFMIKDSISTKSEQKTATPRWKEVVAKYQQPPLRRGLWQLINTLIPYAALWYLMYVSLEDSHWSGVGSPDCLAL